jgi:hypothetical protein
MLSLGMALLSFNEFVPDLPGTAPHGVEICPKKQAVPSIGRAAYPV